MATSNVLSDAPKYAYQDQYKSTDYVWFKNNTQQTVAVRISKDQKLYGDDSPHPLTAGQTASWGRKLDSHFEYKIYAMQGGFPVEPPIMTGTCARGILYTYNGPNNVTAPPEPSTSAYNDEAFRLFDLWLNDPSSRGVYTSDDDYDRAFIQWLTNGGWKTSSSGGGSTSSTNSPTAAAPVVEGQNYFLLSKYNNKMLAVLDASHNNDGRMVMWDKVDVDHAKFRFVPDGNGYYYIVLQHSGKAVAARATENDALVVQYGTQGLDDTILDRFRWKIQSLGDGYFTLNLKAGGRVLTIDRAINQNGTATVVYSYAGELHQQWRFEAAGAASTPAPAAPVVEGQDYFLVSNYDNRTLNVAGSSQNDNSSIVMWNKEPVAHAQFRFVPDGNGYYYITAKHSGKVVAVQGTENNALVVQHGTQGLDNATLDRFRWKIQSSGNGNFALILKAGGRALTIGDASGNGAKMVVYDNASQSHQLWRFEAATSVAAPVVEGKHYFLISKYDNKMLAVLDASQNDNYSIVMWDKVAVAHAQFRFVPDGNGYYYITAKHSGKVVAVQGTENNALVVQHGTQGLDNATLDRFRWRIQSSGDGNFALILKAGGRALTIGDNSGNGAKMVVYDNASQSHQLWRFEAAE